MRVERRRGVESDCMRGERLVRMRNGDDSRELTDPRPRMYSSGLERRDDERETVVVGEGEVCSIDEEVDVWEVSLSDWPEDDESFFPNGSKQRAELHCLTSDKLFHLLLISVQAQRATLKSFFLERRWETCLETLARAREVYDDHQIFCTQEMSLCIDEFIDSLLETCNGCITQMKCSLSSHSREWSFLRNARYLDFLHCSFVDDGDDDVPARFQEVSFCRESVVVACPLFVCSI